MKQLFFSILIGFLPVLPGVKAQTTTPPSTLALEVDPAPFILGGYSVSVRYSPKSLNHFSVMGSVYSSRLPDKMMGKANYEKGFRDLKLETSYALFVDYFLKANRTGFHAGPSMFFYSKSVGNQFDTGRQSFSSIYPNLRVGYLYKPFKKSGLYLNPWFNVGKEWVTKRENASHGAEFVPEKLMYILALHVGYRVTF